MYLDGQFLTLSAHPSRSPRRNLARLRRGGYLMRPVGQAIGRLQPAIAIDRQGCRPAWIDMASGIARVMIEPHRDAAGAARAALLRTEIDAQGTDWITIAMAQGRVQDWSPRAAGQRLSA